MGIVLVTTVGRAEDERERRAREEVEQKLREMVGSLPTKVRIDYSSLDEPNYTLEEATFELDGRPLITTPSVRDLSREGGTLVWNGDVSPGKHTVRVHLVFANEASVVLSEEGGHRWKVSGDVSFDVNAGIEVQVRVVPSRDPTQRDISRRFTLSLPAQPVMVARLDDGAMPEPLLAAVTPAVAEEPVMAEEPPQADEAEKVPAKRGAGKASRSRAKAKAASSASARGEHRAIAAGSPAPGDVGEPSAPDVAPAPEALAQVGAVDAGEPEEPTHVGAVAPRPEAQDAAQGAEVGRADVAPPQEEGGEGLPWGALAVGGAGAIGVIALLVLWTRRRRS